MTLTVYENESGAHVLSLSEDESGIQITGGDPRYIQALKLDQFHDLKQIADYLNTEGSPYQAVIEGESEQDSQDNSTMDDRIAPAIEIINELLKRVADRKMREQQEEAEKRPEAEMLAGTDAEVVQDPTAWVYVEIASDIS